LIFGTAGAVGGGAVVTTGSTAASPGAGRLSTMLNPVISATAKATTAIAMTTIVSHRRADDGTLSFTPLLMFKEFAELDERVEQGLRNLVLV